MKTWQKVAAIGGGLAGIAGAAVTAAVLRDRSAESPAYQTIVGDGRIEIRDYPALTVAQTTETRDRVAALRAGFGRLAAYIFGKNRAEPGSRTKIAMTAPVLSDRHDGQWRTRFIMPARAAAGTLPTPGAGVTIAKIPARRIAVIEFVGSASDDLLGEKERELRAWLIARGERPNGPAEYAFYNSPAVPPLLRRSEVLIPIAISPRSIRT